MILYNISFTEEKPETRYYKVTNMDEKELLKKIIPILSPIGFAQFDEETKTIKVYDIPTNHFKVIAILGEIKALNKFKEIKIKGRIVNSVYLDALKDYIKWENYGNVRIGKVEKSVIDEKLNENEKKGELVASPEQQIQVVNGKTGILNLRYKGTLINLKISPELTQKGIDLKFTPSELAGDTNELSRLNTKISLLNGQVIILGTHQIDSHKPQFYGTIASSEYYVILEVF